MAKLTNDPSRKSQPTMFEDLPSAISSRALVDGVSRCDSPAGLKTVQSGPEVAPVSRGVRRGAALAAMIPAIFGRRGSSSSRSSDLQRSLENRLRARTDAHFSTGPTPIWRTQTTPSGRRIFQRAASERLISAIGYGLWPTPTRDDAAGRILGKPHKTANGTWRHRNRKGGQSLARLAQVCNHLGRPDLARSSRFRGWLMGFPIEWQSATPTATPSSRKSPQPSSKPISTPEESHNPWGLSAAPKEPNQP